MELWFDSLSQLLYGASIIALLFWLSQSGAQGFIRCFLWLCWIEAAWLMNLTLQREEWLMLALVLSSVLKGVTFWLALRRWPVEGSETPKMARVSSIFIFVGLAFVCLFFGRLVAPFYRINGDALSIISLYCVGALFSVIKQGNQKLQLLSLSVLQGGLFLLVVHVHSQVSILWSFASLAILLLLFVRHSLAGKDAAVAEV